MALRLIWPGFQILLQARKSLSHTHMHSHFIYIYTYILYIYIYIYIYIFLSLSLSLYLSLPLSLCRPFRGVEQAGSYGHRGEGSYIDRWEGGGGGGSYRGVGSPGNTFCARCKGGEVRVS